MIFFIVVILIFVSLPNDYLGVGGVTVVPLIIYYYSGYIIIYYYYLLYYLLFSKVRAGFMLNS